MKTYLQRRLKKPRVDIGLTPHSKAINKHVYNGIYIITVEDPGSHLEVPKLNLQGESIKLVDLVSAIQKSGQADLAEDLFAQRGTDDESPIYIGYFSSSSKERIRTAISRALEHAKKANSDSAGSLTRASLGFKKAIKEGKELRFHLLAFNGKGRNGNTISYLQALESVYIQLFESNMGSNLNGNSGNISQFKEYFESDLLTTLKKIRSGVSPNRNNERYLHTHSSEIADVSDFENDITAGIDPNGSEDEFEDEFAPDDDR